nr:hypothetical protein [uncultured Clostridium sp.]
MIDEVVNLIIYNGPTIDDIINNAIKDNHEINIRENIEEGTKEVIVKSIIAYGVKIEDIYLYDDKNILIRQSLIIEDEENIIFDRYKEINNLIHINNRRIA